MSESKKSRFAVDLNEIERQLAQAQHVPAPPAASGRGDPLAELARIVGQDDPFQSLLANETPQHAPAGQSASQAPPGFDDLFAVRPEPAAFTRAAQVRGGHDGFSHGQPHALRAEARAGDQAYGYDPQDAAGYDDGGYDQPYYDQTGNVPAAGYDDVDYEDYRPLERRRSRKGLVAVGAVLGLAVIGGGATFLMAGPKSIMRVGEPPLIKATNEPIKVQPQNPGGVEIPNQNKQIYEPSNQDPKTNVVTRTEQPIDVKQAVRMSGAADATGATASAQPPLNGLNLGEPRKVRTVTIRPDGSIVQPDGSGSDSGAAAPAAPPAMTMPVAAQPQLAQAAPPAPAPAQPRATSAMSVAAPKPAPIADTPSDPSPQPQPKPQRVASAQPTALAPAPEPADAAPTGGFAVQLGLSSSESGAQKALAQFQKKYSDLEGQPPLIRKAEVNGNTIYRVRVGPMSHDDASSLCSKLQGQGGQCFVAKN